MERKPVLVIGATGYVGGRLVPRLLAAGYRVRAFARSLPKLRGRPWSGHPNVDLLEGDVLDIGQLRRAAEGAKTAYYLVHSMVSAGEDLVCNARSGAEHMVRVAAESGIERIIYLDSLTRPAPATVSPRLQWRHEVTRILLSGPTPVTVLRSAMIIGSGSASFEMLRHLVDRLPILPVPTWFETPIQPISIRNVLDYLLGCLNHDETIGESFEIGGPEIVSCRDLIRHYSKARGLRQRRILRLPFLSPTLSAYYVHLLTPVSLDIARPLTEGLLDEVVCSEGRIHEIIPTRIIGCEEAIRRACEKIDLESVETRWSDAGPLRPPEWVCHGGTDYVGGTILECGYRAVIEASQEEIWSKIIRIGGETSWYYAETLWRIRGWMDGLMGGVGLKRGRRHPSELFVGEALDFWRVLEVEAPRRLVLLAEMKTPGEAVLEFRIQPTDNNRAEIRMLSRFLPGGLAGLAYWYGLFPFHEWIFMGMLKTVADLVGKPVLEGPSRFTPKLPPACGFDSGRA